MASYRRRLEHDLEGWIGRGLVPAESRAAILDSVGQDRRVDAATALAVIGALLAGVAVIAFVAANWSAIPRIARFSMVLSAFLVAAGAAAWASARGRKVTCEALPSLAALVFAAAIGLTGQIFDIAGDPQAALRGAGLAALLLALAGRAAWPGVVALVLLGLGDVAGPAGIGGAASDPGWLIAAAPLAAVAAVLARSQALAHAAGLAAVVAVITVDSLSRTRPELIFLVAAMLLGGAAVAARTARERFEAPAAVLYGWFAWGALLWFGASGSGDALRGVSHSVLWLAISAGVVALGRHDRHAGVTGAGVVGLFAAGASLLFNLGVGLLTSAAVFGLAAVVALAVAFAMRRRSSA